jgi:hypothetical protein
MKKLGIVVVYLVLEDDGDLLDLHLRQIEKHTHSPYTIYGMANRLLPQFRERLAQHPQVKISECPTTDLRGSAEHAYYLEHLIRVAIEDDVSHIVTLHVDSFPIRAAWEEKLAAKLRAPCAFITIERIHTACLFFHRDFYLQYRPTLYVAEDERSTAAYQHYLKKFDPELHSGIGYGFRAYVAGLSWNYLLKSADMHGYGRIYDDMIFHLVGAVREGKPYSRDRSILARAGYVRLLQKLSLFIPQGAKQWFRAHFSVLRKHLVERPIQEYTPLWVREKFERERKALLEDPEGYLKQVRTGQKS